MTQNDPNADSDGTPSNPPPPVDPAVTAQQERETAWAAAPATVGRCVYFYPPPDSGTDPWAATVTSVHEGGYVDLIVFPPALAPVPMRAVAMRISSEPTSRWDWPPR